MTAFPIYARPRTAATEAEFRMQVLGELAAIREALERLGVAVDAAPRAV